MIHQYFGDSTPDGLQFQFRAIRQAAANLRQGKTAPGGAGPSTPGGGTASVPKTPRTTGGRKRAAPSGGKTPASKRTKTTTVTTAKPEVAEDDESEVEPFPVMEPVVSEEAMRAHEAKTNGLPYALASEAAPSLASARAVSIDEDEDVKVITPADAAPSFSFSQSSAAAAPAYSFSQSTAPSGGPRYDPSPFYNSGSYQKGNSGHKGYPEDEPADEDEYDV